MRWIIALHAVLVAASSSHAQDTVPSYMKDIRPFLNKYCVSCHKAGNAKAGLNLESYEGILKGSKKGRKVLIAGSPDESRLVTTTEGKSRPVMPPRNAKVKPAEKEVAMLRAWVAAGARDDTPVNADLMRRPRLLASDLADPAGERPGLKTHGETCRRIAIAWYFGFISWELQR